MDTNRPALETKFLGMISQICHDTNGMLLLWSADDSKMVIIVPVIVIFTKYEAFQANVTMDLEDKEMNTSDSAVKAECERRFNEEYYVDGIKSFVKLESE